MRKLMPFLLLAVSLACAQNKASDTPTADSKPSTTAQVNTGAPPPITDAKARELGVLRDKVDPALSKLQPLPAFIEYQKAMEEKKIADARVDAAVSAVKALPEGKEYVKVADEYALALQDVLKGVDQTKWKLGPGFTWVAQVAPKTEVQSKKEQPPKGSK